MEKDARGSTGKGEGWGRIMSNRHAGRNGFNNFILSPIFASHHQHMCKKQ